MQNEKNINIGEKVIEFLQRNRKGILILTGVIVVFFVGLVVHLALQDTNNKKAIIKVEELSRRYEDMRFLITESYYEADLETLLVDLQTFAKNKKGYGPSKAWSIVGQIHSSRKDWQKSKDAWLKAARSGNKTYLAPMALFNAAAAAEELGNIDEAIELLQKCIAHTFEFPAAPRAQFSIGRLYEKQNNYSAAMDAYRTLLIDWQDAPLYQNLARSRIVAIEIR